MSDQRQHQSRPPQERTAEERRPENQDFNAQSQQVQYQHNVPQGPYPQTMHVVYTTPYPQYPGYYAPPPPPPPHYVEIRDSRTFIPGGYDSDAENGNTADGNLGNAFSDKAVRRGFIKKVYGILLVQLLITGAIVALFVFVDSVKSWVQQHSWLYIIGLVLLLVTMIALVCFEGVRRKAPVNYVVLGIFTLLQGFVLGVICAQFDTEAVLIAVGACAAVSLALTLFAFQSKWDFTTCGGMLCALLVVLFVCSIVMIFVRNKYAMICYGGLGALIFSLYIVYDTQLMMGGNHKYSLDPEEYIFAALNLYLDVINLLIFTLLIVVGIRSD